jgi:UDP-2-acetamido-2,6-beta-L-arabino-hexul-4-ose reductase
MNIIITGETGFIGYHLAQYLTWIKKENIISVGRDFQNEPKKFTDVDWVIHLAGINRADDRDIYDGNVKLANDLVNIFTKNNITPNVLFISSIQESLNNSYGNSKIEASKIIKTHCNFNNKSFISLKLPNVFGPFCKPNYNSFIATFCNNISKGIETKIIKNNNVPLIYVQDVCKLIYESILQNKEISFETEIVNSNVSEILNKLIHYNSLYNEQGIFPKLHDKFDINLFNTFRSYINPVFQLTRKVDNRGALIEILKCELSQTQMFYSITKPNIIRGNHFHFNKIERFMILKGTALIEMRKIGTNEIFSYIIKDTDDMTIDMPIMYTHSLKNIGDDELICCFWTQEIFNQSDPDTYFETVNLI